MWAAGFAIAGAYLVQRKMKTDQMVQSAVNEYNNTGVGHSGGATTAEIRKARNIVPSDRQFHSDLPNDDRQAHESLANSMTQERIQFEAQPAVEITGVPLQTRAITLTSMT